MLRPYMGVLAIVMLGGCSSTFFFSPETPVQLDPGPADYQALVAQDMAKLKDRASMGPFEISPLRKTRLAQPGDWMACVRTTIKERPTHIAVFMHDGAVLERRLAVL